MIVTVLQESTSQDVSLDKKEMEHKVPVPMMDRRPTVDLSTDSQPSSSQPSIPLQLDDSILSEIFESPHTSNLDLLAKGGSLDAFLTSLWDR